MMSPSESIAQLSSEDAMRAWDRYVHTSRGGSVYHLSGWRRLIERVFGCETYYFAAERGGQMSGVLPLVRLKSFLFGDFLVSMPYVTYGGVLANDASTTSALIDAANDFGESRGASHIEFRHSTDCCGLPKRTEKISMCLSLGGDSQERWKQLGSKRRAQIKRSQREGAESEIGGIELVEDFYSILSIKYRDLGVPIYPLKWFRGVLEEFPDLTRVFLVRLGGKSVAGSITIGFKGSLEVPWASSLRSADRLGVNMFLYWEMLKYAEDQGFKQFDFGRCTEGSNTWRFKRQWGAEPVQLYWHYWMRNNGELPVLNATNPKYSLAVSMWRKLPVPVANRLGPMIVKNLP